MATWSACISTFYFGCDLFLKKSTVSILVMPCCSSMTYSIVYKGRIEAQGQIDKGTEGKEWKKKMRSGREREGERERERTGEGGWDEVDWMKKKKCVEGRRDDSQAVQEIKRGVQPSLFPVRVAFAFKSMQNVFYASLQIKKLNELKTTPCQCSSPTGTSCPTAQSRWQSFGWRSPWRLCGSLCSWRLQ